ncbi:MAG: S8 family serine peptidase [Candidatus Hodarchaeota archaeon]
MLIKSFYYTIFFIIMGLSIISFTYPSNATNYLDPTYNWHLQEVGIEKAWSYTQGSKEIVVAVIDSGIDFNHPDLLNQSWVNLGEIPENGKDDDNNGYIDDVRGWDFRGNDNDPSPPYASLPPSNPPAGHYHGTFVAGLIAADNDADISVGVAPNISLMNLRFLDENNAFSRYDWGMFTNTINYAVANGANIIHLSIQACPSELNPVPPKSFFTAIKKAYESGVIIVSVTGNIQNCGKTSIHYPGNYSEVIAVSATTRAREHASFSCTGDQNEISAPGENIYSIYPNNYSLSLGNGTSFAAPLVSGTIALMLSLNRYLTVEDIREVLHETSTDLGETGKDPVYGYGLLNASAALEKVITKFGINTSMSKTTEGLSFDGGFSIFFLVLFVVLLKINRKGRN